MAGPPPPLAEQPLDAVASAPEPEACGTGRPRVALLTSPPASLMPELRDWARREPQLEEPFWLEWGSEVSLLAAQEARLLLIRTTWDYADSASRRDAFVSWLRRATTGVRVGQQPPKLVNPLSLVEWNSNKQYLLEMEAAGVPIVPTTLVRRGEEVPDLRSLAQQWGDKQWIVAKPVVAASARGLAKHKVGGDDCAQASASAAKAHIRELATQDGAALVQPFMESVLQGETSAVCVGGEVLCAVLKRPGAGDFRVQSEFGGTVEAVEVTAVLRTAAERALEALPSGAAYARLDFVLSEDGLRYLLMEVELVEPELYFDLCPEAATALARHVAQLAGQGGAPGSSVQED